METPTPQTQPVQSAPQTPTPQTQPVAEKPEEKFLQKNKTMIFGGIVALIVLTVIVGIGLSVKNTSKLEGMIMKVQEQATNSSSNASDEQIKIPRK